MASFTPPNISNGYAQSYIHDRHDDTPVLTRLNKQSSKIEKQGLKLEDLAVRFDKLDTKLDKVAENMTELKIELNKTIHECEMRFERALSSWLFRTTVLALGVIFSSLALYLFPPFKMFLTTKAKEKEMEIRKREVAVKRKEMALENMVQGEAKET